MQVLLGLAFVAMLGLAALFLMVMHGPISIGFLVGPFEEAISRELGTGRVSIENAVLRQSEDGRGIEFRLANLRILDVHGAVLAETPLAGISLSGAAILRGRIAPVSVEFIRPKLRLTATPEGGLALAVSKPDDNRTLSAPGAKQTSKFSGRLPSGEAQVPRQAAQPPIQAPPSGPSSQATQVTKPIDIVAALQTAMAEFRHGEAASSYLRELGLRDATLTIEHGSHQAVWHVPGFSVDVQHFQKRSVIVGEGLLGSTAGPWGLSFRTTESNKAKRLRVEAEIAELIPQAIAANVSFIPALSALEMPVAGTGKFDMTLGEGLSAAEVKLTLSPGRLVLPAALGGPVQVTRGALNLSYSAAERRIIVHPSELVWNQSRAVWTGTILPGATEAEPWRFEFVSKDANLNGVALDSIEIGGSVIPDSRHTRIDKLVVNARKASVALSGGTIATDRGQAFQLDGQIGPMTLSTLLEAWPKPFAPNTANWIRQNVQNVRMTNGTIRLGPPAAAPARSGHSSTISDREADLLSGVSLAFDLQDLQLTAVNGSLPVVVDAANLRIEGDRLEITAPHSRLPLPSGRSIPLKDPRLVMFPLSSPETLAEISLQSVAPASMLLELIDQEPFNLLRSAAIDPAAIEGRTDTSLRINFPAVTEVTAADVKLEGRIRLTEARSKSLVTGLDVSNGNVLLGLTDKALDAKGDVLIGGVPAKISWQRIFGAPPDRQPPARLTATLDAADRDTLGIAVNHMVLGDVPVVVTVQPDAQGQPLVHLEANLGAAELLVDTMAWRKAAGRPAVLHSDIARTKDGRVELTSFKIIGDDIALDGHVTLDAKNQLRSFNFPAFAVNVLTKLEMSGRVRDDGVLEVKTKGTAYDGRAFFRSLFGSGQASEPILPASKDRPGLDLAVEIDTLIGYTDTNLRNVRFNLKRRGDKIVALQAAGNLSDSGVPVNADIRVQGGSRMLHAESADAGSALRLIGFYPNMRSGSAKLEVNLDGKGYAEKTGRFRTAQFAILGDPVVSEVLQGPETARRGTRKVVREQIEFDRLDVPFSVGHGQVVLGDSTINGPLLGARLNGKIDYNKQTVFVEGTYVPLYGLNSIPNSIPIIGDILSGGRSGDGLFGITFQIQGPMGHPLVQVNPLSMLTPGLLRQIWETAPQGQTVIPRAEPQGATAAPKSSSAPPQKSDTRSTTGSASSSGPQRIEPAAGGVAPATAAPPAPRPNRDRTQSGAPRIDGQ